MYKIKKNIKYEIVDNNTIIIDMNKGKFLSTNLCGYCILNAIKQGIDVSVISNELSKKFMFPFEKGNQIIQNYVDLLFETEIIE